MIYRAVLFDLDGTLLDTLRDIADSMNSVLAHFGFPQHEVEAYKYFVGDGIEALAIRALPEDHRDEVIVDKIIARMGQEYSTQWANSTRPYQGIPELLDVLTGLGIKMAILSNKPQSFVELMVSRLLPQWRFELVLGASPPLPRKPDPTGALQIAKQMNIRPVEFLYLGDSAVDMKTATAANMYPVGALWGFRMAAELLSGGARVLIQHPSHLLQLLHQ
jgi:phosphoglycolate phosphatase